MHNAIIEVRPLPAGADLKRTFLKSMLEWIDAGWEIASSIGGPVTLSAGAMPIGG